MNLEMKTESEQMDRFVSQCLLGRNKKKEWIKMAEMFERQTKQKMWEK